MHPVENCCQPPYYIVMLDDVNNDDQPEVIWWRSYNAGDGSLTPIKTKIWIFGVNGQPLDGWPVIEETSSFPDPRISVGDVLPNEPGKELVVTTYNRGARLFLLNGTEVTAGWPIPALSDVPHAAVLANLDNTGGLEAILCGYSGPGDVLAIVRGDGTALPGWPKTLTSYCGPDQPPLAADLDGDGAWEIIAVDGDRTLRIWHLNGAPPVETSLPSTVTSPMAIADIDNQPGLEILVRPYHTLRAYRANGAEIQNALWPKSFSNDVEDLVVGDLRNDGTFDLLASTSNQAFLFDLPTIAQAKGQFWPVGYGTPGRTSVVAQCIDGTAFGRCSDSSVSQRCVNGELRYDTTCTPSRGEKQQVAP